MVAKMKVNGLWLMYKQMENNKDKAKSLASNSKQNLNNSSLI
jgi:hypothetical protein